MVYFLQGETTLLIKIGKTNDIAKRLSNLQAASADKLVVLAVIEDAPNDHPYHEQFKTAWSHGEWFHPTPELVDFIKTIPASQHCGMSIRVRGISGGPLASVFGAGASSDDTLSASQAIAAAMRHPEDAPRLIAELRTVIRALKKFYPSFVSVKRKRKFDPNRPDWAAGAELLNPGESFGPVVHTLPNARLIPNESKPGSYHIVYDEGVEVENVN